MKRNGDMVRGVRGEQRPRLNALRRGESGRGAVGGDQKKTKGREKQKHCPAKARRAALPRRSEKAEEGRKQRQRAKAAALRPGATAPEGSPFLSWEIEQLEANP
jgi:hypothetical protein